jgi:hypothetical protein
MKNNYVSKEIVKNWNQGGYGIGVIRIDKNKSLGVLLWISV